MSSNTILGLEWNLSPDGLDLVTSHGALKDPKQCLKTALDSDLKTIGRAALPNLTSNSKMVLQIAKIRNVAAPKANEQSQAAPRMLKLTLTDGEGYVQAIEVGAVTSLSRDKTAPGTKCLVDGAKLVGGFLLVNNGNFKVLGGHVEHLYDKWQVAKSVKADHLLMGKSGGAPPWVPFGHKLAPKLQESASKESKDVKDEASEFELQRKEAIMEVSSGAVKKTFGGRVRQNVVSMPQQQKYVRNVKKSFRTTDDVEERLQKPSEKVSLFAFLEDKLPQKSAEKSASITKELPQFGLEKQQRNKSDYHEQNGFVPTSSATPRNVATQQHNNNYSQPRNNSNNTYQKPYQDGYGKPHQDGYGNKSNYPRNNDVATYQKPHQDGYGKPHQDGYGKPHQDGYRKPHQDGYKSDFPKNNDVATNYQKPRNVATEELPKSNRNNQEQHQNSNVNNHNVATLSNAVSKMSINSEFATRTLRNHLNLPQQVAPSAGLNVGDQCMAKYWEDGRFYPASVAAVTDRTYAVRFQGYGNIEEVLRQDCFVGNDNYQQQQQRSFQGNSSVFRNNRRRNYD